MSAGINLHQALYQRWYEEYRERRYLEVLDENALVVRGRDLMSNITTLTPDGKLGALHPEEHDGHFVWRLFSHWLEECRLRTGDPRGILMKHGLQGTSFPKPSFPIRPVSDQVSTIAASASHELLFKFSQRSWAQELVEHGALRIAPASMYADSSLGPAISDDELGYDLATREFARDLREIHPFKTRLADVFGAVNNTPLRATSSTNYLVWCASSKLDLRLFDDFGADVVVVINNPVEFVKRIVSSVRPMLPQWSVVSCLVNYFDPFHPTIEAKSVFRSKHFKYMYQREFRLVFLPPTPTHLLEPIFVQLGDLRGIATLVDR